MNVIDLRIKSQVTLSACEKYASSPDTDSLQLTGMTDLVLRFSSLGNRLEVRLFPLESTCTFDTLSRIDCSCPPKQGLSCKRSKIHLLFPLW